MPFSSQFAIALELTNVLPIAPVVRSATSAAIKSARDLRRSGSDLIVEEDLAEVFGRNRIENRLESSFRTAVKESVFRPLSKLLDVVLEGGAGPTVLRSLQNQNRHYFATVVQLSLLSKTHELNSLSSAICRALEKRLAGQDGDFPDQSSLRGTIKAIRDQTSGFRWDLMLSAVEAKLAFQNDIGPHKPYEARPIPFAILQGLLDAFTAVQWFPEQSLIRIKTYEGVSTLVVWAHVILGLVVVVIIKGESIRFGEGKEQVLIECYETQSVDARELPSLMLFRSVNEPNCDFQLTSNPAEDSPITPACFHSAGGFGTKILSQEINDVDVIREMGHKIIASCLLMVREAAQALEPHHLMPGAFSIPTEQRVLDAGTLLFDRLDYPHETLQQILQEPCIARCVWADENLPDLLLDWLELPSSSRRRGACPELWRLDQQFQSPETQGGAEIEYDFMGAEGKLGLEHTRTSYRREMWRSSTSRPSGLASRLQLQKLIRQLCNLVFAFSFVSNALECSEMLLDLYGLPNITLNELLHDRISSIPSAFKLLAELLLGPSFDSAKINKACVVSNWGWSIVLGTTNVASDFPPHLISNDISIYRGVPTRNRERKDWILDGLPNLILHSGLASDKLDYRAWYYRAIAHAGNKAALTCIPTARFLRPYVGTEGSNFETFIPIQIAFPGLESASELVVNLGYRSMQELAWRAIRLPSCAHPAERLNTEFELPAKTIAFTGHSIRLRHQDTDFKPEWKQPEWVHLGLVAGNSPATWVLLNEAFDWSNSRGPINFEDSPSQVYLRSKECCVACAVDSVKTHPHNGTKVLLL